MALVAAVLTVSVVPTPAWSQECEIPLFVQSGLTGANVMVLADNSGSMNSAVYHPDYDKNTAYTGTFVTESNYFISKDKARVPSDFNAGWPSSPSINLINSDNGKMAGTPATT